MPRILLALLMLAFAVEGAGGQSAMPADWPSKPIRLVVPFPAGSSTDVIARIVAQMLRPRIGGNFVIENRVGASGMIGMEAVAHAAADGYTIGIATTSTQALAPSLSVNVPYDPLRDFAPVAMIGSSPYVLVTYPGLGAKTVPELVALAKARPGKLTYGSAGPGSLAHLAFVLFANTVGAEILHVPYKSSAQSVTDLIAGRLDMQFSTIPPTLPFIRNGQMRGLATSGAQRTAVLPELPTVAESGLPGYEAALWTALVMPPAAPPALVARLNRELVGLLGQAETKAALTAQGVDPEPGTPEALRARVASDIERWRSVIVKAGLQAE